MNEINNESDFNRLLEEYNEQKAKQWREFVRTHRAQSQPQPDDLTRMLKALNQEEYSRMEIYLWYNNLTDEQKREYDATGCITLNDNTHS